MSPRFDCLVIPIPSWHIHYNTNSTDMARFQQAFTERFIALFPPAKDPTFGDKQVSTTSIKLLVPCCLSCLPRWNRT